MAPPNSQANANCFAWQEFIALSWPALLSTCDADTSAPLSAFGDPASSAPVVWETYKEASEVFRLGAVPPSAWCAPTALPPAFAAAERFEPTSAHGYRFLTQTSKFRANPVLTSFGQAGTPDAWLTAQNGRMVFYEVRLNNDEFTFIVTNRLYDANVQASFAASSGLNLPDGVTGAIELKSSWVELPDSTAWPFFKTSRAWVAYPGVAPRLVTVGLTGLHIIHKTRRSPQLIWATFEHVHNAPDSEAIRSRRLLPWYTFFDANCNPAVDHYKCAANAQPPGASPSVPYFPHVPVDPYTAPIQVVRLNSISTSSTDPVDSLNRWVWQNIIRPANSNSVFLNYQLVDVLWSNAPTVIPAGARVPLPAGTPVPAAATRIVANTTMETYFQQTKNCMFCHQYASVAASASGAVSPLLARPRDVSMQIMQLLRSGTPSSSAAGAGPYASDYSFLFSDAQAAATPRPPSPGP